MRAINGVIIAAAVLAGGTVLAAVPAAAPAFAQDAGTAGVAVGTVSGAGTLVVDGTTEPFIPRSIDSVGLLYPAGLSYTNQAEQQYFADQCGPDGWNLGPGTTQQLQTAMTAMTTNTDMELLAMKEHWQVNTVRFHLSQGALAYEHENGLSQYTDTVISVIEQARAMGLVVIVDVDTEKFGCTPVHEYPDPVPGTPSGVVKLPTGKTKEAWDQLTPALGDDPGVILEPMNEPNTGPECDNPTGSQEWTDWAYGCGSPDIGMLSLGNWLRTSAPSPDGQATGVSNVLLFDGDNSGNTFTGFNASSFAMPAGSAYAVHPFYYVDGPDGWDQRFGDLEEAPSPGGPGQGQAVVADAWNESANCPSDPHGYGAELVDSYLPDHYIGLSLQAWDAPDAPLVDLPLSTSNTSAGDPVLTLSGCATGADVAYAEYWSQAFQAGVTVPTTSVEVSPPLTWKNNVVDGVTIALASNGTQWSDPPSSSPVPPDVVSSVKLLIEKNGSTTKTLVATMTVSDTGSWWDNGSYSTASASGLSGDPVTAQANDTLIFRVYYQGVSGYQDTDYLVPAQS
jgi:Cellulase (glycosyl hydrolase family 5)